MNDNMVVEALRYMLAEVEEKLTSVEEENARLKEERRGDELEIVLRSGERISCTPSHKFPTTRGLLTASELIAGDILMSTRKVPQVRSQ